MAAGVPPGFKIDTDANRNVKAIAVTGGPRRHPSLVVVPSVWAMLAVPVKAATFPHVSEAAIHGVVGNNMSRVSICIILVEADFLFVVVVMPQ